MSRTPLSPEKYLAKLLFTRSHKGTPEAQKVQEYLQEVHGISVPEDFAFQVALAHFEFHGCVFTMDLSIIDSVIAACEYWKEYVEDFDALVCREILSMCRIHTSVVWLRNLIPQGFVLKKEPSYNFETIVTNDGLVIVRT